MASFWERAQNLVDDHQDRQVSVEAERQKAQMLGETRDALLGRALEVKDSYREELAASKEPEARREVHSNYAARLEGLNDAFAVLRQSDPGITTKIDLDQFRKDAERYAEQQQERVRLYEESRARHEQSRGFLVSGNGSGFSY
jgi:phage protein D